MNEMLEEVALALADAESQPNDGKRLYRMARAAIDAMRGADLSEMRILLHAGTWETAQELWNAVIDAALSDSAPATPTQTKS